MAINTYVLNLEKQALESCVSIFGKKSPDFIIGYILSDYKHLLCELQLTDDQLALLTRHANSLQ
jgi:hypothetical protein